MDSDKDRDLSMRTELRTWLNGLSPKVKDQAQRERRAGKPIRALGENGLAALARILDQDL
jgi:hypothetical protein